MERRPAGPLLPARARGPARRLPLCTCLKPHLPARRVTADPRRRCVEPGLPSKCLVRPGERQDEGAGQTPPPGNAFSPSLSTPVLPLAQGFPVLIKTRPIQPRPCPTQFAFLYLLLPEKQARPALCRGTERKWEAVRIRGPGVRWGGGQPLGERSQLRRSFRLSEESGSLHTHIKRPGLQLLATN